MSSMDESESESDDDARALQACANATLDVRQAAAAAGCTIAEMQARLGRAAAPLWRAARLTRDKSGDTLKLGDAQLDATLRGTLRARGGVVELCGAPGAGKTQFALRALLAAQRSREHGGLAAAAIYVATEGGVALIERRLSSLALDEPEASLSRIVIKSVTTLNELVQLLRELPLLLRQTGARLLVIDSIAALFRGEFGAPSALAARAALLAQCTRALRQLSDLHDAAVLVTNQLSAAPGGARAALGPSWAAGVAARLALSSAELSGAERRLVVEWSARAPAAELRLRLGARGLESLPVS